MVYTVISNPLLRTLSASDTSPIAGDIVA